MKHCRWKTWLSTAALAGAVAILAPPAWAATQVETLFELDGNQIDQSSITNPDAGAKDDWGQNNFPSMGYCPGNSCGYVAGPNVDGSSPGGHAAVSTFIDDPNGDTGADDIFTGGGSKDDLPMKHTGGGTGWQWTTGSPPDKDDLLEVGAAAYLPTNELLIYDFGFLFAANGDSSIGNWFFKKDLGPCANGYFGVVDSSLPGRPCVADQPDELHTLGDVLIISENTNGGTITNISVYVWVGTQQSECGTTYGGTLVPPKKNLCLVGTFAGSTCGSGTEDPFACGIMNQTSTESVDDYGFTSKFPPPAGPANPAGTDGIQANDLPPISFFESGINISEILGSAVCFSSFLKNTRTSASVRSQLKDFANGSFALCGISVTKTCPNLRESSTGGYCPDRETACTAATEETDCGTGEVCDTTNPQFLFGETTRTQFAVEISKTGPADFSNVELNEVSLEHCDIVAGSDLNPMPTDLEKGAFVKVLDTLSGTTTLTMECDTPINVSMQKVQIRAEVFGATVEDETTFVADAEHPCTPSTNPRLSLTKMCNGDVKLMKDSSDALFFHVKVKIVVKNTGDEDLTNVTVLDDKVSSADLPDPFPLDVGDTSEFELTYDTIVPDDLPGESDPPSTEWSGCDVFFTDTASVTGATGVFSGALGAEDLPSPVEVSCPFCPATCSRN